MLAVVPRKSSVVAMQRPFSELQLTSHGSALTADALAHTSPNEGVGPGTGKGAAAGGHGKGVDARVDMWMKNFAGLSSMRGGGGSMVVREPGAAKKSPLPYARSSVVDRSQGAGRMSMGDRVKFMYVSMLIRIDRNLPIINPKTRAKIA